MLNLALDLETRISESVSLGKEDAWHAAELSDGARLFIVLVRVFDVGVLLFEEIEHASVDILRHEREPAARLEARAGRVARLQELLEEALGGLLDAGTVVRRNRAQAARGSVGRAGRRGRRGRCCRRRDRHRHGYHAGE